MSDYLTDNQVIESCLLDIKKEVIEAGDKIAAAIALAAEHICMCLGQTGNTDNTADVCEAHSERLLDHAERLGINTSR